MKDELEIIQLVKKTKESLGLNCSFADMDLSEQVRVINLVRERLGLATIVEQGLTHIIAPSEAITIIQTGKQMKARPCNTCW